MREIIFRGKLSHNNEWVVGNLVFSQEGNPYIIPSDIIEQDGHHLRIFDDNAYWVNENTIGQYVGMRDKNGTMIFEGDIIEEGYNNMVGRWTTKKWIVKWNQIEMAWMCYDSEISPYPTRASVVCTNKNVIEVIGNIHDNRNLLK